MCFTLNKLSRVLIENAPAFNRLRKLPNAPRSDLTEINEDFLAAVVAKLDLRDK